MALTRRTTNRRIAHQPFRHGSREVSFEPVDDNFDTELRYLEAAVATQLDYEGRDDIDDVNALKSRLEVSAYSHGDTSPIYGAQGPSKVIEGAPHPSEHAGLNAEREYPQPKRVKRGGYGVLLGFAMAMTMAAMATAGNKSKSSEKAGGLGFPTAAQVANANAEAATNPIEALSPLNTSVSTLGFNVLKPASAQTGNQDISVLNYKALDRSTVDRDDDFKGPQIHLIVAGNCKLNGQPVDNKLDMPDASGTSFVTRSFKNVQTFFYNNSHKVANLDTWHGKPDVSFLDLKGEDCGHIGWKAEGLTFTRANATMNGLNYEYLPNAGFKNTVNPKLYMVYADFIAPDGCGRSPHEPDVHGGTAVVYIGRADCAPFTDNVVANDLVHASGLALKGHSLHYVEGGYVNDNVNDLMYFPTNVNGVGYGVYGGHLTTRQLDPENDDYLKDLVTNDPAFGNLPAPYVEAPSKHNVKITVRGHGTVSIVGVLSCKNVAVVRYCNASVKDGQRLVVTETPGTTLKTSKNKWVFSGWGGQLKDPKHGMDKVRTVSGVSQNTMITGSFKLVPKVKK